jgi:hypothetical protein
MELNPFVFQMSSFPPRNWEVRYLQDMDTFTAEPDNHTLSLATLLAVKPAGAQEGNFRLVLAGTSCALTVLAETVVRLRLRLPPPAS